MKDHATFISAMEALPNVRGLMVGSGTQQLPVPANVQAIGVRQDVQLLYAAADVVVSTSVFGEGFSNVIAEGMSAGLVPIATDVGDARRIIGDTGRIVPPRDRVALMDFIMDLAAGSPGARQARGLRARARILANFTLAQAVDTFANFYAGNVTCNVGLAGAVTDATAACATTANLSPEKGRLGE
jgi:glycosyltransferase involved in cell wall biosynthesis